MTTESNPKKAPRRRRRTTRGGRGGGMPPIMWLGVLVCVVGAVVLFRSGGGDAPVSIGENQTVVTAPDTAAPGADSTGASGALPRSGDVDISDATRTLTPEKPADGARSAADQQTGTEPAQTAPAPTAKAAPAPTTSTKTTAPKTTTTKPAAPPVTPSASGVYVVQVGSFASYENAEKELERLKARSWPAHIKMSDTSEGSVVYRVRIGYFASSDEAKLFIQQNRRHIKDAVALHR
jgi:cell division septation protein DedD